jgi:uncharacterized protein (TIGR03083 family)
VIPVTSDPIEAGELAAFFEACEWAESVLASPVVSSRWSEPSVLAEFSVGGLSAHLVHTVGRLEHSLVDPVPPDLELVDLATAFGQNFLASSEEIMEGMPALIRQSAEERAGAGHDDLLRSFRERVLRLRSSLPATSASQLVPLLSVPKGALDLATYLKTRVVELVVHTDDLAVSVAQDPGPIPDGAADVAIEVVVALARARHGSRAVVVGFSRSERADLDSLRVF